MARIYKSKLRLSGRQRRGLLLVKLLLVLLVVAALAVVVWLAWVRPTQRAAGVDSFQICRDAGNIIQESYPEVCVTKDGKRFVNPTQDAAHQSSLQGTQAPIAPSDPALLQLDIEEWGLRLPLTAATFDLSYSYLEDGLNDRVQFSYKRLVQAGICAGDIGLSLSRLTTKREPPYSLDNPAPVANVGAYYYYAALAGSPCYDPDNAAHTQLVQQIAGQQSLTQTTQSLLSGLQPIPE